VSNVKSVSQSGVGLEETIIWLNYNVKDILGSFFLAQSLPFLPQFSHISQSGFTRLGNAQGTAQGSSSLYCFYKMTIIFE